MYARREDGLYGRQTRSRDAYSDDFCGPTDSRSSFRRTSSREPSPGGVARLSTSAPDGWDPPPLREAFSCFATSFRGRCGPGGGGHYNKDQHHLQPHGESRVTYVTRGSSFNAAASSFSSHTANMASTATRRRQASPQSNGQHSRPASSYSTKTSSSYSASSHAGCNYVNGDVPSSSSYTAPLTKQQLQLFSRSMAGRPKSFPSGEASFTRSGAADNGSAGFSTDSVAPIKERVLYARPWRSSSPSPQSSHSSGQRGGASGGGGRGGEGMVNGGARSRGRERVEEKDVSPVSDEAMSSVTLTETRAMSAEGLMAGGCEGSFTSDDGHTWHTALTCYLCGQLFRRPRILPCGHTFCSDCLAQLKDELLREGRRMPGGPHAMCTWGGEGRSKPDSGAQFACPMPDCRYTMRLMNVSRWSTRNKTVADAVTALRRMYECRKDASTQTDITMESILVTIPRSLIQEAPPPGSEQGQLVRRNSSSLLDRVVHRAISMDCLSRNYIPQPHTTWRSYVAMLGMHILQQVIHT